MTGLHDTYILRERYFKIRDDYLTKLPKPPKPLYLDVVHFLPLVVPYGNLRVMHLLEGVYGTDKKEKDLGLLTKGLYGGLGNTGHLGQSDTLGKTINGGYIPLLSPKELYRTNVYSQ